MESLMQGFTKPISVAPHLFCQHRLVGPPPQEPQNPQAHLNKQKNSVSPCFTFSPQCLFSYQESNTPNPNRKIELTQGWPVASISDFIHFNARRLLKFMEHWLILNRPRVAQTDFTTCHRTTCRLQQTLTIAFTSLCLPGGWPRREANFTRENVNHG